MANLLIVPPTAVSWRVDTDELGVWLQARWPEIERASNPDDLQRATVWTWPDLCEVWVPADTTHTWIAADVDRIAAVAAHLGSLAPGPLVLCDEGYSFDIDVHGRSESEVLGLLRQS